MCVSCFKGEFLDVNHEGERLQQKNEGFWRILNWSPFISLIKNELLQQPKCFVWSQGNSVNEALL